MVRPNKTTAHHTNHCIYVHVAHRKICGPTQISISNKRGGSRSWPTHLQASSHPYVQDIIVCTNQKAMSCLPLILLSLKQSKKIVNVIYVCDVSTSQIPQPTLSFEWVPTNTNPRREGDDAFVRTLITPTRHRSFTPHEFYDYSDTCLGKRNGP